MLCSSAMVGALLALMAALCASVRFDANDFVDGEILGEAEVEEVLLHELTGDFKPTSPEDHRMEELQALLRPMYMALPKDAEGKLGHSVVRYALHRLLVQHHGWYVKGLEPNGGHRNALSSEPPITMPGSTEETLKQEWVPAYMQWTLEQKMGGGGLTLRELAVVAASLEDLVRSEEIGLLKSLYKFEELDQSSRVASDVVPDFLATYMSTYLREVNLTKDNQKDRSVFLRLFREYYQGTADLEAWLLRLRAKAAPEESDSGGLDFTEMSRIVEDIGTRYAVDINDGECRNLKHFMLDREDAQHPGRILLSEFYKHDGFNAARWLFNEKLSYLRAAGALDESDPEQPSVIIPNYVSSKPQCLEVSQFFGLCCRNECEELLGHLEKEIASETASPERLAALVENLPSDTVKAPRHLSETLRSRLDAVAAANGGRVPVHGRLFAQWMHHAFPRECPFPHAAGTTSPQTPDQWMTETGESAFATAEEMVCHVSGDCAGGALALQVKAKALGSGKENTNRISVVVDYEAKLPWIDAEELLQELPSAVRPAAEVAASLGSDEGKLKSFNSLVGQLLTKGRAVFAHKVSAEGGAAEQIIGV